jgi:hypothetical protein
MYEKMFTHQEKAEELIKNLRSDFKQVISITGQ